MINYEDIHSHKVCGVSGECEHTVFNHKERGIIEYKGGIVNSSGAYYLTKDTTYDGTLSGDLYICLNGYTFNFSGFDNGYNIYITDCGEGTSRVDLTNAMLTQKIYILGTSKNTIEMVAKYNIADACAFNVLYISNEENNEKQDDIDAYTNIDEIEVEDEIENKKSTIYNYVYENATMTGRKGVYYADTVKNVIIEKSEILKEDGDSDVIKPYYKFTCAQDSYLKITKCNVYDDIIDLSGKGITLEKNATLEICNNTFGREKSACIELRGFYDSALNHFFAATVRLNEDSKISIYNNGAMSKSSSCIDFYQRDGGGNFFIGKNSKIRIWNNIGVKDIDVMDRHLTLNGKFNYEDSLFSIYTEWKNDGKLIVQDWYIHNDTDATPINLDKDMKDIFIKRKDNDIVLKNDNVNDNVNVYEHTHSACGEINCNHSGISEHGDNIGYDRKKTAAIQSSGAYYIYSNVTSKRNITLTGDLYLCLK